MASYRVPPAFVRIELVETVILVFVDRQVVLEDLMDEWDAECVIVIELVDQVVS